MKQKTEQQVVKAKCARCSKPFAYVRISSTYIRKYCSAKCAKFSWIGSNQNIQNQ